MAVSNGQGRAVGAAGLPEVQLRRLLANPEELLWRNVAEPIKIDQGAVIVEAELPLAQGTAHVAYKRYRARGWRKAVAALFRRSRARKAWLLGHALLARGIATARPLAMIEPTRFRLSRASYLATEWIDHAENLHLFGWRLAERPLHERLRQARRCAESLGGLLGGMHAQGVSHRDLKAANLLAGTVPRAGERLPAVYLVDVDGVRIGRRLTAARRAAELARLAAGLEAHRWISHSVCCRFLRAYVAQCSPVSSSWKALWRAVDARRQRIVRRKRRRGEQVL